MKPGIEPATPGLQGKQFIHYTTAAPANRSVKSHLPIILASVRQYIEKERASYQIIPSLNCGHTSDLPGVVHDVRLNINILFAE